MLDDKFSDSIIMKAGTSETVNAPFTAYPSPKIVLTFKGGDVRDEKRISPKISEDQLVFSVQKAQRPDTGDYELTLENDFGKATLAINVLVLGKPGSHYALSNLITMQFL